MTAAPRDPAAAPRDPGTGSVPRWFPAVALVGLALPVALLVGAASGAMGGLLLMDAGPLVRIGLPALRVVHDLAASLTVGMLLVAAFLAPEGRHTRRRATAARLAAGSGAVWTVAAGVGLVFSFADLAGLPLTAPGFWADLTSNVWPLELTRLLLIETVLAALLVPVAWLSRTRGALAWAFVLSLAALLPLSFAGHASGTEGHEQAMTALMFHLFGVTVWVGGLLAIVVLRPLLGKAVAPTVRRFSTLALWCYGAVAVSGVLFALLEADDLGDLTSSYWLVLWGKVLALLVLGWFGYRQRERVLAQGVERSGAFARLALTELAVMGIAIGLAVALSRTPTPDVERLPSSPVLELTGYPMPPAWEFSRLFTQWQVNWLFLPTAVVAVVTYLVWVRRLRSRGDSWPLHRTICWVIGWVVFAYATNGAPGVYGRIMFSQHMVMHMLLMMAVPIFLVVGSVITLALRSLPARKDATLGPREILLAVVHSRYAAFVANPLVAGLIFFGSLIAFYWTEWFPWALTTHSGHVVMVAHFTIAGYAFVWSLIGTDPGPAKWPAPLRMMVLIGTLAAHAFFGLALMTGTWLLAPGFFKAIEVPYVPDLLEDQQLAGGIAWGIGELPTLVLAMLLMKDWLRSDSREAARKDRQAERDGDAELAAYNAHLQELAQRNQRRPQ